MKHNAIHYLSSTEPEGYAAEAPNQESCPHISSGNPKYDYIPGYAWKSIENQFTEEKVALDKTADKVEPRKYDSQEINIVKLDKKEELNLDK